MSERPITDAIAGDATTSSTETNSASRPSTLVPKQRNRVQHSCKRCRQSKLRCNRAVPCDQCEKRGFQNSCEYLGKETQAGAKSASVANKARQILAENIALRRRISELEQDTQGHSASRQVAGGVAGISRDSDSINVASEFAASLSSVPHVDTDAGALLNESQRHVSDIHWEAILRDVGVLTLELEGYEEEMDHPNVNVTDEPRGPLILVGGFPEATVEDLLEYLPSKSTTDRLVTKFYQLDHPAWVIFHIPTFLKQACIETLWDEYNPEESVRQAEVPFTTTYEFLRWREQVSTAKTHSRRVRAFFCWSSTTISSPAVQKCSW